jgi:hypothetical protein
MKPNIIVGEAGYRLKITDTNAHRWKSSIQMKRRGYLKSVTGKMETGQGNEVIKVCCIQPLLYPHILE